MLWVGGEDDAVKAGWRNPHCTALDVADVLMKPLEAVRHRARFLRLKKNFSIPPRLIDDSCGVARLLMPGGNNHVVILDSPDLGWFLTYPRGWFTHIDASGGIYVYSIGKPIKKLHRVLLGLGSNVPMVDHKNHNGLDNRRDNLRLATSAQNNHNSRRRKYANSQFKGVWLHAASGRYTGVITDPIGKRRSIGYYDDESQAARAHDALARHYRGSFAFQNIPSDPLSEAEIASIPSLSREMSRRHREEDAT